MTTHSVFLCGKFQGQRSLVGYNPWGCKESDTTEWQSAHARTHTHLIETAQCDPQQKRHYERCYEGSGIFHWHLQIHSPFSSPWEAELRGL